MKDDNTAVVITSGEPAGIGVDLCVDALSRDYPHRIVVIGDSDVLSARARLRGMILTAEDYESSPNARRCIWHCPRGAAVHLGAPSVHTAGYVLEQLHRATDGFINGDFSALVTAPINKDVICQSGINFSGHTEYLADRFQVGRPLMLIAGPTLRVALATTHLPLCKVPAALSEEGIFHNIKTLAEGLGRHFGISKPKIKVAGLNPHAGEGGFLGDEEIRIIKPAILRAQEAGILASGPFPADTLFIADKTSPTDAVLAMYHDQGLPVVKFADFDGTINITLGLPFLRVSPAHGTATNMAGKAGVRFGGMRTALNMVMQSSPTTQ